MKPHMGPGSRAACPGLRAGALGRDDRLLPLGHGLAHEGGDMVAHADRLRAGALVSPPRLARRTRLPGLPRLSALPGRLLRATRGAALPRLADLVALPHLRLARLAAVARLGTVTALGPRGWGVLVAAIAIGQRSGAVAGIRGLLHTVAGARTATPWPLTPGRLVAPARRRSPASASAATSAPLLAVLHVLLLTADRRAR